MNYRNAFRALFDRNFGSWFLCAVLLLYHFGFVMGLKGCYAWGYLGSSGFKAYGVGAFFLLFLVCQAVLSVFLIVQLVRTLCRLAQRQWCIAAGHVTGCLIACLMMWHMNNSSPYCPSEIVRGLTESFIDYADVSALRAWADQARHDPESTAVNYDGQARLLISKSQWPDAVHALTPTEVDICVIDETRYVLVLKYGGAIVGRYGVAIIGSSLADHDEFDSLRSSLGWRWGTIHIPLEMAGEGVFVWSEPTPKQEYRRRSRIQQNCCPGSPNGTQ